MKEIMSVVRWFSMKITLATGGDSVQSVMLCILGYFLIFLLELVIETLVFGDSFLHWGDLLIAVSVIVIAVFSVIDCIKYKAWERKREDKFLAMRIKIDKQVEAIRRKS